MLIANEIRGAVPKMPEAERAWVLQKMRRGLEEPRPRRDDPQACARSRARSRSSTPDAMGSLREGGRDELSTYSWGAPLSQLHRLAGITGGARWRVTGGLARAAGSTRHRLASRLGLPGVFVSKLTVRHDVRWIPTTEQ